MAASNFTMPAMSPTMTEGNIARWKVKEGTGGAGEALRWRDAAMPDKGNWTTSGDSFTAGDVLLEIETDKAQMDVEAQEDGIMAKITVRSAASGVTTSLLYESADGCRQQGDGAKAVKVGSRIAVVAEPDDDLGALSIPKEEPSAPASPHEETAGKISESTSSESQAEAPPTSKPSTTPAYTPKGDASPPAQTPRKPSYPLYPSVQHILRQHGMSEDDASKIPASGPRGRLLKGDVLAYLGSVDRSYASELSARVTQLGHLDLSNVKPAAPRGTEVSAAESKPSSSPSAAPSIPEPPQTVALPISLDKVRHVQHRVHRTLGISLPLSTFLARAADVANRDLPASSRRTSSIDSDELFDQILGLDRVAEPSMGRYVPQITALPESRLLGPSPKDKPSRDADVYDILTGHAPSTRHERSRRSIPDPPDAAHRDGAGHTNLVAVSVADKAEQHRAQAFLGRLKTILELEPGRLIL